MTNPLQGSDEETPPTFADMLSHLETCTHMNVTSTEPDVSQQWHERRNKARLALLAKWDSLESALREAQKDAERIDYLQERRSAGHSIAFATSLDALMTAAQHTNTWDRNGNIREAIDAAKASR